MSDAAKPPIFNPDDYKGDPFVKTEQEKIGKAWDAAGVAATEYYSKQRAEIERLFTTKRLVKVKYLLGEVGSAAMGFQELTQAKKLGERIARRLLEVTWTMARDLANDVMNDPAVVEALSSLNIVQDTITFIGDLAELYDAIIEVCKKIEPWIPAIEIASELVLAWASGGTTAIVAGGHLTEFAQEKLKRLTALAAKPLRDAVYETEVEVPEILLKALDTFDTQTSQSKFWSLVEDGELAFMTSDSYHSETLRGLRFTQAYRKATEGQFKDITIEIGGLIGGAFNKTDADTGFTNQGYLTGTELVAKALEDFETWVNGVTTNFITPVYNFTTNRQYAVDMAIAPLYKVGGVFGDIGEYVAASSKTFIETLRERNHYEATRKNELVAQANTSSTSENYVKTVSTDVNPVVAQIQSYNDSLGRDTIDGTGDRTLSKGLIVGLVLDKLANDGVIINTAELEYNEKETAGVISSGS